MNNLPQYYGRLFFYSAYVKIFLERIKSGWKEVSVETKFEIKFFKTSNGRDGINQ